jgi:hypothetical protein
MNPVKSLAAAALLAGALCGAASADEPLEALWPGCHKPIVDPVDMVICQAIGTTTHSFQEAQIEARRRAHLDPGAIPLCPPPHKMTARDGCR